MNKEKIQDRYLKEYKTIYVDIGDGRSCSLVIPVYYNETLPNDFILRPEILTQIAVLNLTSKNEELQQRIDKTSEYINNNWDGCSYTDETLKNKVAELNITELLEILKGEDNE